MAAFIGTYFLGRWRLPGVLAWARLHAPYSIGQDLVTAVEAGGAIGLATIAFGVVAGAGRRWVERIPVEPGEFPLVFGVIPRRARWFQARPQQQELERALRIGDVGALVAISGAPGSGKSQVAAAYARQCAAEGYDLVAWINAETGPVTDLAQLGDRLGLRTDPEQTPQELAAEVASRLSVHDGLRRLVVFDNVEDPASLSGFLHATGSTKVIITSNRREVTMMDGVTPVEVGMFTSEQGQAFLTEATGLPVDPDALDLGVRMGWLPLGLAQAATYMRLNTYNYRQYLAVLASQDIDETLRHRAGAAHRGVLAATALSLRGLRRVDPSGDSGRLLTVLALLSPDGVSRALLRGAAPPYPLGLDHTALTAALTVLANASLITLGADAGEADHDRDTVVVTVHRLIALVIRHRAGKPPATRLAEAVTTTTGFLAGLAEALPLTQVAQRRAELDEVAGHIVALRGNVADPPPALLSLCFWAGGALLEAGNLTDGVPILRASVADRLRVLGPDHPDTLTSRHSLAMAQGLAGHVEVATAAYTELLADRLRVLGPDHPDTLTARHDLIWWQWEGGDVTGAAPALEALLADRLRVLGPDHVDTLTTRHNLGAAWAAVGDMDKAVAATEDLLADQLRVRGPDHPDTLAARNNLAAFRGHTGDARAAARALVELLVDRLRVQGPDHPDTLTTRNHLARWQGEAGDPDTAVRALTEVLADRERVLGPDHPATLTTRADLARWQGEAGQVPVAVRGLTGLLADRERILGPNHPDTQATRVALANWRGRLC